MTFITRTADPLLYQHHLEHTRKKYLSALAAKRGIANLSPFLTSDLSYLVDPFVFTDMEKAVRLVSTHLRRDPKSFVLHCDYDCDGMMASYIFTHFVRCAFGCEIHAVVNDRETEGYGLTPRVVQKLYDQGCRFILTADNGVASSEAASLAKSLGMTLVITDHHEPKIDLSGEEIIPPCDALLCHKVKGNTTQKVDLCGAATLWTLCRAIDETSAAPFIDAAGLATVVDMVSLADVTNRLMVKHALSKLNASDFSTSTFKNFFDAIACRFPLSEIDFGFGIGPVINAVGRIAKGQDLVDALCSLRTTKEDFAPFVALNEERKELTTTYTTHALELLKTQHDKPYHLMVLDSCPEGILGLIASRIENMTFKPTLVLTPKGEELKGSGRSRTLDLQTLFDPQNGLPLSGGGHKEACGLSFLASDIDVIERFLSSLSIPEVSHTVDGVLPPSTITHDFISQIEELAPFGTGFERPSFLFSPPYVQEVRILKESHLAFVSEGVKFICFNYLEKFTHTFNEIPSYHVTGKLSLNEYKGTKTPQVMIERFIEKESTHIMQSKA